MRLPHIYFYQTQTPTNDELEFERNIAQQASKYFLCIYFLLPKDSNEIVEYFRSIEQQNNRTEEQEHQRRLAGQLGSAVLCW